MRKSSKLETINIKFLHIFFIVFSLMCLIPFIIILSISFSKEADIVSFGYGLVPKTFDLLAYKYVFSNPEQILQSYKISIIVTIAGTFVGTIMMAMVAYPLSRRNFQHRKTITFYIFFTMLFSGGLVPTYILVTYYLGMKDTMWSLIIPGLVNAWHIILLRTFFQDIPSELSESAKIDGCSEYGILFKIIMPLSKPALATVAFLGAMFRWNDWFSALLYVDKDELLPLQYLLYRIMANIQALTSNMQNAPPGTLENVRLPGETARMAMCVLAAGPMLFVFPLFQKYFVKGLTVGSIKG